MTEKGAVYFDLDLIGDQARPRQKLMWIAPSPLLQSSFGVVSDELLQRLKGYEILYLGQNYLGAPYKHGNYTLASYSGGDHIFHYLTVFNPDVTVLFQSPPFLQKFNTMAKFLKERTRVVIYTPVESIPLGIDVNELFSNAELILVPSKHSQECLRIHGGKSEVLYHGVDTDKFKPVPKPNEFTIGSIASHVWRKQLTRILDAHKIVIDKGFSVRLFMFASTYDVAPWQPDLRVYAMQIKSPVWLNETALLNLPINQQEITTLYGQMRCHIQTSTEAFGLTNLESMATGTVPIIVNHGASPEIVGDCGIYARISDYLDTVIGKIALVNVNDLADKIIWAVQNPDELRKLAAKGLARAKLFSWQTASDRLGELLAR